MAASSLDKIRKGYFGGATTLSASISPSDTTIPLSSTVGLPTDTGIDLTIDRVDANGTKTPSKRETVTVVISGSNGTAAIRGREGTAQAHSAGAIVEITFTAKTHNDMVDAFIAQHSQLDGTHTAVTATSVSTTAGVTAATALTSTAGTVASGAANHLSLNAGTNKLVRTTLLRQDDTTNTYQVGNSVMLTGWGVLVPGATTVGLETVTFGVTFLQRPIVVCTYGGDNVSGTLTYGSGTPARNNAYAEAVSVTTTSFQARVVSATAWGASDSTFYQWIATGEI